MANTDEVEESGVCEYERLYIQRYAKYSCCVNWSSELVTCFLFGLLIAGSWIWFHVGGIANEYSRVGALMYRNWNFVTNNIMLPRGIDYIYSEIWDLILIYYFGGNHLDYNWEKFSIIPRSLFDMGNVLPPFYIVRDSTWSISPPMSTDSGGVRFRSMLRIRERLDVTTVLFGSESESVQLLRIGSRSMIYGNHVYRENV
eukprot:386749_1